MLVKDMVIRYSSFENLEIRRVNQPDMYINVDIYTSRINAMLRFPNIYAMHLCKKCFLPQIFCRWQLDFPTCYTFVTSEAL